mgnify:CR=1 FL=1
MPQSPYLCDMQIDQNVLDALQSKLAERPSIVITNHVNPDGDAVGSATALYGLLKAQGHQVQMIMPNAYSDNLKWMVHAEEVLLYEEQAQLAETAIDQADLIIHLDYNALARSGKMEPVLTAAKAQKLVIDHHQQPDDFPDYLISDTAMSSTCEMVFHFAAAMDWLDLLNRDLAEALYCGISTDTGNFKFSSTSPLTHRVAAQLLEKGVRSQMVSSQVYDSNRLSRFKLLGRLLENMEPLPEYGAVLMHLSPEDIDRCGFEKGDTEGFVNYGLSIKGMELSVFIVPRDGAFKLSFRSKTSFDVNQFARKYWQGGGHKNAAGGSSDLPLDEIKNNLKEQIAAHAEELQALV